MNSSSMPRLLFAIADDDGEWSFFSLPQLQNQHEKSSSATTEFHVKTPSDLRIHPASDLQYFSCAYVSGLIYFNGCHYSDRPLVFNPNTGRYAILPYLHRYRKSYSFLGFEPIDKQYRVLFMAYPFCSDHHKLLTLGIDMRWRKIKCSLQHEVKSEGVCINGVLYYLGGTSNCCNDAYDVTSDYVIVCFDLRYEKFTFIEVERFCRLINYKGKLAVIFWEDDVDIDDVHIDPDDLSDLEDDVNICSEDDVNICSEDDVNICSEDDVDADTINELSVWVLEDAEKQEWLKYVYTLSDDKFFRHRHVFVAGVTDWGEIVFAMSGYTSNKPFYVFYFNPEKNTLRRVEIQGFGETFEKVRSVWTFVNHVEDLNANDPKLLESVHAPFVPQDYSESDPESV